MTEPIFWLSLSLLLVAVCLTAVLMTAIPALKEVGRAARSAEKLFDTLYRELPPTLEAIRLTGLELTDLTDDLSGGVQGASQVVQQVDQGLQSARRQVHSASINTRSAAAGLKAAWRSLTRSSRSRARQRPYSASVTQRSPQPPRQAPTQVEAQPITDLQPPDVERES